MRQGGGRVADWNQVRHFLFLIVPDLRLPHIQEFVSILRRRCMKRLEGSCVHNPWVLDGRNGLRLANAPPTENRVPTKEKRNAAAQHVKPAVSPEPDLRINKGPASRIGRTSPDPWEPALREIPPWQPPPGPARTTTSIRSAREEESRRVDRPHRGSPTATPPPRNHQGGTTACGVSRGEPLTAAALYDDAERPPVLAVPKPHHVCGMCRDIKSHPVSYRCGHSHCFVCIRVWLETHWTCPDCRAVMYDPPFRHYGEEKSIAWDYPWWKDTSRVSYSFQGLTFPRAPLAVLEIDDSP
ncbi:hypothetical protein B0H11DRAFT_1905412 [Mycena galericulata]|nr:hypothetical protein B0H11DRAFT_1905412 [Mycena galericulata]